MEKSIKRITNIILIVIAAVAIVAGFFVAFKGEESQMGMDISMYLTYAMVLVAIVLILVFAFAQIASNKKQLISTLIMLAVVAVIVFVCYLIAPSELSDVAKRVGVSENIYRWVGASINFAYITFAGVIVALLGSMIYMKIKK